MDFKAAISKAQPVADDLLRRLSAAKWGQRILNPTDYPTCIAKVPGEKLIFAMASGDILVPVEYCLSDRPLTVVAGLDSFRNDPNDRFPINKDHFLIVPNTFRRDFESAYLSLGPFKRQEDHWLTHIPDDARIIPMLL